MLRKHWQFPILLAVLVCVYSVCPLFCAAFGQILCSGLSEKIQMEYAETSSSCCHKTDAASESETPSESETACCLNSLELILPSDSHNGDVIRESLTHQIVSIVPFSATLPTDQEILLHLPSPSKLFTSLLNSDISRRGPPYTRS
ncbi:hypothetical protein J4G08_03490 [Candidatus Poribacteria bacterium]|nr:hypothetical protein [Candidatus Poribacteria bacterium]